MFNSFKKFSPAETPDQDSEETMPSTIPSYSAPTAPSPVHSSWQSDSQDASSAHTPLGASIQRAQPSRNVLNSDVEVKGTLRFQDDLLVDGIVEGKITSEGSLTIGQNARIQAEIKTKSVTIHGKVVGNISVSDRVELKSTAELVGDIQAATFTVESGAIFIGHSTVGAPSIELSPARQTAKKAARQATLDVEPPAKQDPSTNGPSPDDSSTQEMQF